MTSQLFKAIYIDNFNWEIRTDNGIHLTGPRMCYIMVEVENWAIGFCSSWGSPSIRYIGAEKFMKDLEEGKYVKK